MTPQNQKPLTWLFHYMINLQNRAPPKKVPQPFKTVFQDTTPWFVFCFFPSHPGQKRVFPSRTSLSPRRMQRNKRCLQTCSDRCLWSRQSSRHGMGRSKQRRSLRLRDQHPSRAPRTRRHAHRVLPTFPQNRG